MTHKTGKSMGHGPHKSRLYAGNISPDQRLSGLVSYWYVTSKGEVFRRNLTLAPDEHMDILFMFRSGTIKGTPMLLGLLQNPVFIKRENSMLDVIGVKFTPGSFYSLFKVPADAFVKRIQPLSSAIGKDALRFNKIFTMETLDARIQFLDSVLLEFAKTRDSLIPEIKLALENIYASKGTATIRELADAAGWTRRWFTETFKKWIGLTPRSFCNSIRFAAALRDLDSGRKPAAAAQEANYSDQSHLTRTLKNFTGYTPKRLLRYKRLGKILPLEK